MFKSVTAIILFIALGFSSAYSQEKIQWLSWEEAIKRNEIEQRKFVVDVYTEWCGWCKKMDKATFQHESVSTFVNDNYYPIKFDAEFKKNIQIKNKSYKYVSQGRRGYHELAAALTEGKMSYPTVVFLDEKLRVIQPLKGYHGPEEFSMIVRYFAKDHYKTTPWKKFMAIHKN